MSCGKEEKVNVFLHGHNELFKTKKQKIFSAQVWCPKKKYHWKHKNFKPNKSPLLIYECHIGMAQDAEKVGSYLEFKNNVLPHCRRRIQCNSNYGNTRAPILW